MKKLLSLAAVFAMVPAVSYAQFDNIYGNGGVHTAVYATEAEAIAEGNQIMETLSSTPSHELVYILRTPHKSLKHNSVEIYDADVKVKTVASTDGAPMYQGFVDVEYRFARYD
jgi:hypothetical protein